MAGLTNISSQVSAIFSPLEQFLGLGTGGVSVNTQYSIFLDSEGVTIQFPVMPAELPVKYPSTNQVYNLLAVGEVVQPRLPGLAEFRWESFFPARPAPWVNTSGAFEPPEFYIEKINGYKKAGKPVRFIVTRWDDGALFDTNVQAVVEDFEHIEKGGEVGDFYYNIRLREYRPYSARKVTIQTGSTPAATPAANTAGASSITAATKTATKTVNAITEVKRAVDKVMAVAYTVRQADTLWRIAKQQLNDGSAYSRILTLNGLPSINAIKAGMRLRMPGR